MITRENTLTERERFILRALACDPDAATASRAQALLAWADGESREQIAQANGLRTSQIQQLTRAFAQKRLEIFAPSSVERASRGLAGGTSLDALLQEYHINMAHARFVADLSLQIFDGTREIHQVGPEWRRLLETGALLHNLGSKRHDEQHHRIGRNIILAHELEGFTPRERDILACLTLFHTKKVKAPRDAIFAGLDAEGQRVTLALAAILRIADGLDFSQTQSTGISSIQVDSLVLATAEGPQAELDASRANKKADLWRDVLTPPFSVRLPGGALPSPVAQKRNKPNVGMRSQETVTRAGRKIVAAQLARVRVLEDQVRGGHDANAVHDMRVATRRMRSALRMFARFYPNKVVKKIRNPLRELGGLLGEVRDLDVMLERLRTYTMTLPLEQQRALDPLLADWQARRAQAHRELVEFIEDGDYADWIDRMEDFIEGRDDNDAPRVADLVPSLIWKRYGKVRAFEPYVKQADLQILHRLRIQCKRLRYAIEFFTELLGPEAPAILEPLIALQDYIGELHDADAAAQLLTEFIATRAQSGIPSANLEGVTGFLSALRANETELQAGIPDRWQIIIKPGFRQELGQAVAAL